MGMFKSTQSPAEVVSLVSALIFLDVVAVVLRFYARRRKGQPLMKDDWLTIPALILNILLAVILIHGAIVLPRTSPGELEQAVTEAVRNEWVFFILSVPSLGCIKLSILYMYRRIFVISIRDFKDAVNLSTIGMIVIVIAWTVFFFVRYTFACGTHFAAWLRKGLGEINTKCPNYDSPLPALAISDFCCDLIILFMPWVSIWKLRMSLNNKLAVTAVFALGAFAVVASLMRMIWVLWSKNHPSNLVGLDVFVIDSTLFFWNFLEIGAGLLAACVPILKGLVNPASVHSAVRTVRGKFSLGSSDQHLELRIDASRSENTKRIVAENEIQVHQSFELNVVGRV